MSRRSRHWPLSTVSPKWTIKQDQKLRQAVNKYGTQWSLISKKYRFQRSVNSLVKRWHGKLKQQVQKGAQANEQQQSEQQKVQPVVDKSKRVRKEQKKQVKKQTARQGATKTRNQRSQQQQKQQNESNENDFDESPPQNSQIDQDSNEQQDSGDLQNEDSEYYSKQIYVFQHNWKQVEDSLLRDYILNQKILDWEELSSKLKIQPSREIKRRWQKYIYPSIVQSRKIGGCVKYSQEEDAILNRGVKLGMNIQELRKFLPSRTLYSLDARRRRTLRIDQQQTPQLRYWIKKLNAYKFVQKRHQHIQKPASEDSFMYRSDSQ